MENRPAKRQKGRYRLKYRGVKCLNCGHPLDMSDKYCPNCSQANSTKKLSLKDFFDEFFSSLISYDSKLLKTLSALLLKPGKITKDYIDGKRVSYTNPFRFLLSLAIVYFLMLGISGNFEEINLNKSQVNIDDFDIRGTLDTLNFESERDKREAMTMIDSLNLSEIIGNYTRRRDSAMSADATAYFASLNEGSFWNRYYHKQEFFQVMIRKDSLRNFSEANRKFGVAETKENKFAFNSGRSFVRAKERPGEFLQTLISRLPFATFFFLPVFALFIWLAYIRKKHTYTDHLIFSFHNMALLFILLICSYLIDSVFTVNSNWIFLTIFSIYLFEAMRKFYGQNIFKTIVKYVLINTIFFILATFSTLILFAGNLITF